MQMQKAGDEALAKAKRTRFRPSVDFMDVGQRMIEADNPELLTYLVLPLLAPKIKKTFPMSRVDDLLLYKPEESAAEERMKDNFSYLLRVLLDKIKQKKEVTLAQLNDLYAMKFPDQVLENRDYYAFLVHLSQKEHYDLDMIKDHPDTFLEDTMADFLKANPGYEGLKFRLIYLPDETISILERFEMSNIRFERTEE